MGGALIFAAGVKTLGALQTFKEKWLHPFLFFGKNRLSLIGGAITTATALTLVGFWVVDVFGHGGSSNPYLGIIVFLILPAIFVFGLVLIPIGIVIRRRHLRAIGQLPATYPKVDLGDPLFRQAVEFVAAATFINFLIVGVASYRGVAYMDTPSFCGTSCHVVMAPEWTAYQYSAHSHVACVDCHVGAGAKSYVRAKVNGTKQLIEVTFNRYPTPVESPVLQLRPAREICEGCHTPAKFIGEKLLVKTSFADDETNSVTRTLVLLHLGGRDSLSHLTGIHGVHLGHIEYVSTDARRQVIPWVSKTNADGSTTDFSSSDPPAAVKGERRVMDCIDCHNRAAHTFQTPEDALNRAMTEGAVSPSLPFIHKQALQLLKADYASQSDADVKITSALTDFYHSKYPNAPGEALAYSIRGIVAIYKQNVFPDMKVTWGTHPNNVGHNSYPGCFRCHDGSHNTKDGKTSITNDCAACHNLLAVDEAQPKLLSDLGIH
jgi:nitrate/TMAO reductase-like tetraheme cytochrome c subunit